jgi:hypothetical protein
MAGSGPQGIVPVRGQVLAMRANAPLRKVTTASWSGNEGYWFPRPVAPGADDDDDDEEAQDHPLVILGGARDSAGLPFEMDVTDDAQVDKTVGAVLRAFLPDMFPGLYKQGREPEAEWVRTEGTKYVFFFGADCFCFCFLAQTGIMGYTKLNIPFVRAIRCLALRDLISISYAVPSLLAPHTGRPRPRQRQPT